jgi:putative addiction module component (TIGR02574 family)
MGSEFQSLIETALSLPEAERVLLVDRLLESLPPDETEVADDEFAAELDRRYAEYLQDPTIGVPWAEAKSQILKDP